VDFLYGQVESKNRGDWRAANLGDRLPRDAQIRIGEESIVELSDDSTRVTVSVAGTHIISDLLRNPFGEGANRNMGSFLEHALEYIFRPKETPRAESLGVRAEKADAVAEISFMTEDEILLEEMQELNEAKKYREMAELFESADSLDQENSKIALLASFAHASLGNKGLALQLLKPLNLLVDDDYYHEWAQLKGQLLYESFAVQEALEHFTAYAEGEMRKDVAQTARVYIGLCQLRLGNAASAKKNFEQAKNIDPLTEAGKFAANMISDSF
jgi:tetratricopeptide (TPR) repeat protein